MVIKRPQLMKKKYYKDNVDRRNKESIYFFPSSADRSHNMDNRKTAIGYSNTAGFAKFTARFTDPEAKLRWKLDGLLLVYVFVAGIMKEMDQDATTQAYVSGMKEDLSLNGNELVWFQTYFSIAYAICIVPAQIIQTKVCYDLTIGFTSQELTLIRSGRRCSCQLVRSAGAS